MRLWIAALSSFAGVVGAAGVGLAAVAAHRVADPTLMIAAYFLLFHAPALLALCVAAHVMPSRLIVAAAALIGVGVLLFSGDLAVRALTGLTLLRLAAPTGGMILIAGWLLAAVALPLTIFRHRRDRDLGHVTNIPQTDATFGR